MLLFLFVGLLLLRFAVRQLFALLFQLPPRFTRFEPSGYHPKALQNMPPEGQAIRLAALALGRFPERQPQVLRVRDLRHEVSVAFHFSSRSADILSA